MPERYLTTYLNDHLAGATSALALLGTLRSGEHGGEWDQIERDIRADREELEGLMTRAGIPMSSARQRVAWTSEKLTEFKLRLDDPDRGALHRLELLELLALGIDGKRALWMALQAAAGHAEALRSLDYPRLIDRAHEQRQLVELRRLQAATDALR
jgi:hypothetical protein